MNLRYVDISCLKLPPVSYVDSFLSTPCSQQATGAVLVSREPNKVILYRGYGEGKEAPGGVQNKHTKGMVATGIVSPQLIEAIRIECGLQANT